MFCPYCGAQLKDDARFCGKCGKKLGTAMSSGQHPASGSSQARTDSTTFSSTSSRLSVKTIVAVVAVVIVVIIAGKALSGGKLSGTYVSSGIISQSFTFDGNNVTMSAFGVNATGTYKISGNKIIITYTLFGNQYEWEQSFSKSGKTITIGGTDFVKR